MRVYLTRWVRTGDSESHLLVQRPKATYFFLYVRLPRAQGMAGGEMEDRVRVFVCGGRWEGDGSRVWVWELGQRCGTGKMGKVGWGGVSRGDR